MAGAEKECEIEDGPDNQKPAYVDIIADISLCVNRPFREHPGGEEEKGEGLLCLVAEQNPAGQGGDGP